MKDSYPIQTAEDFKSLREAMEELMPLKKSESFWSPALLKTLKSGKDWAEANGTDQDKLLAWHYLMIYYDNHIEDDLVIAIGEKLLSHPGFFDMPESVRSLLAMNSSYRRKGYYQQQLNIVNSLIEQNERFDYIVRPSTYGYFNELALVYYNLGQYNLARHNFRKQAALFSDANDLFRTSSMLNNIGLTYAKQQNPDSALVFYEKAIRLLEEKSKIDASKSKHYDNHFENVVKANIVKASPTNNQISDAETIFKNVLASSKRVNERTTIADTYQDLATLYFQHKKMDLAKSYNDSSLIFEKSFHNPRNREKGYLLKTKIELEENRSESAAHYFNLAISLKDSLNKAKEENNFSEATAKYNFIKTGEALEENRKMLQQKERANLIQLVFLCIVVLLVLIIGAMLYRVKKANSVIDDQKNALQKGLKEKEIMLDEIHHRIKNNLQVVSGILELQRDKIGSQEHAKIFEESQDYLQSMSMIHELLYEQEGVTTLDMQVYINRLGGLLIENYPSVNVEYMVSATTVHLDVSMATPLALMICELITNSLKHAFSQTGKIEINLIKNGDCYVLNYADNGIGFDHINDTEFHNTGLNLIFMLAEDLDGEVEFFNNNGFHCVLNFKG